MKKCLPPSQYICECSDNGACNYCVAERIERAKVHPESLQHVKLKEPGSITQYDASKGRPIPHVPEPKRRFEAGERCKVYTSREKFKGKIDAVDPNGNLHVIEDGFYSCHEDSPFHPRQCVKLRSRKAEDAREPIVRWLTEDESKIARERNAWVYLSKEEYIGGTRIVECPETSRVVSREDLAKAWDGEFAAHTNSTITVDKADKSGFFLSFCQALGFPQAP